MKIQGMPFSAMLKEEDSREVFMVFIFSRDNHQPSEDEWATGDIQGRTPNSEVHVWLKQGVCFSLGGILNYYLL